jgi:hypothetical protein
VPAINASRVAGQTASRMSLAKSLTGTPNDALSAALASRVTSKAALPSVSDNANLIARALAMRGITAGAVSPAPPPQ